ncbi:MAG: S-layer family protein [Oscillatoriaceae cyanobacterium Prado104]|jgi:filamentous hemagglutinin family protein|nr:S-layer family protein [Oscillatoriaceae cyanobacterium Prado104]
MNYGKLPVCCGAYFLLLTVYFGLFPGSAIAQIIPDSTLGSEGSRTAPDTINNLPSDRISGGAIRGSSLFHSFREFNVNEGQGAYFENPQGISNIFTRVTGGNRSNILGTLGVLGSSNLFLINPQGIVFGPNATLDLRGSFFATTADSIVFNNNLEFSATNPQTAPLLTVSIPVGLRFRENPGAIVNRSTATGQVNLPPFPVPIPIPNNVGLAVDPDRTLALIGGDIQLAGGNLTANNGQIILGSVASPGIVNFTPTPLGLTLNYNGIANFGNIQISGGSLVNTSGTGGGKVDIRGENVTVSGSRILALTFGNTDGRDIDIAARNLRIEGGSQLSTFTLGNGAGGNINLAATDSIEMSGRGIEGYQEVVIKYLVSGTIDPFDPNFLFFNGTGGAGNGGSTNIDTGRLVMRDGVVGSGITFGTANAGNLNIRANSFEMAGSAINNATAKDSSGAGGSLNIDLQRLIMTDGSLLASTSYSTGSAGNITIKAAESVELFNARPGTVVATGISTLTIGADGRAGDITVDTKRLSLSGGSSFTLGTGVLVGRFLFSQNGGPAGNLTVRASESVEIAGISQTLLSGTQNASAFTSGTLSSGKSGNIRVDTPRLTVRDGGIIATDSFGLGNGGDITINADRIDVIGSGNNGLFVSAIDASVGKVFGTNPNATANAGELNLNTRQLNVRDGAAVTVQATGTGRAGNINIVADSIALDTKGRIDGSTASGAGANLNLQARDIQLRRGSRITTDAGAASGGNINITSDTLAAIRRENSDITANARSASGGRVNLNVPNVFGFTVRTREQVRDSLGLTDAQLAALQIDPTSLLPTSDIAAISQNAGPALQGTVTFSSSGVNPARGLVELPQNVVDPEALIAANPCVQGGESAFTVTGKGGVPPSPNDALSSESAPFPWVEVEGSRKEEEGRSQELPGASPEAENSTAAVVPARGWVRNDRGEVVLVGYNAAGNSERNPRGNSGCLPAFK